MKEFDDIVRAIAIEIQGWDTEELKVVYNDDGDGHHDFEGFTVTEKGREAIRQVLQRFR